MVGAADSCGFLIDGQLPTVYLSLRGSVAVYESQNSKCQSTEIQRMLDAFCNVEVRSPDIIINLPKLSRIKKNVTSVEESEAPRRHGKALLPDVTFMIITDSDRIDELDASRGSSHHR